MYAENNVGYAPAGISGTFSSWGMTAGNFDYNFFYNFDATGTETGPNGSTADPAFVDVASDDLSPKTGSPLIGAGDESIGGEYAQGLVPGTAFPDPALATRTAWDVGAYVFGATASTGGGGGAAGAGNASSGGAGNQSSGGSSTGGASAGGAGGGTAASGSGDDGGCGCRTTPRGETTLTRIGLLALLCAGYRRRPLHGAL